MSEFYTYHYVGVNECYFCDEPLTETSMCAVLYINSSTDRVYLLKTCQVHVRRNPDMIDYSKDIEFQITLEEAETFIVHNT